MKSIIARAREFALEAQVSGDQELALIVKAADRLANLRACVADGNDELANVVELAPPSVEACFAHPCGPWKQRRSRCPHQRGVRAKRYPSCPTPCPSSGETVLGRIPTENIMTKAAVDYQEGLRDDLADPREAAAYLNAALEDGSQDIFLLALRDVTDSCGHARNSPDAPI